MLNVTVLDKLFVIEKYTKSTECLKDCPSINFCYPIYVPLLIDLLNSGETNGTVYFVQVYNPYMDCLWDFNNRANGNYDAQFNNLANEDFEAMFVWQSCLAHFYTAILEDTFTMPCLTDFLYRYYLKKNHSKII